MRGPWLAHLEKLRLLSPSGAFGKENKLGQFEQECGTQRLENDEL